MNLCFITHESSKTHELNKIPSGVITILLQLCEKWPDYDKIIVLTNKRHWAYPVIREKFKKRKNIIVKPFPWILVSEFREIVDRPLFQHLFFKIVFRTTQLLLIPFYIIRLTIWLLNNKVDGVLNHNGGWPAGELNRWVAIAAKIAAIKNNILVIHNTPSSTSKFFNIIEHIRDRFIYWCCKEIITVSQSCRKSLIVGTNLGSGIKVIYNGINISPTQQRKKIPLKKDTISVGFVGEVNHRKGVHVLFESLKYVHTPCEVIIIGNGDKNYIEKLKDLQTDIPWPITFLGYREDVIDLYEGLDIVVLPSIAFESFGLVLIEAMICEKPVICSDFGGMKEVVDHEQTGLIVPANNAKTLALALDQLLSNVALRCKMGKAGRKRVVELFSDKKMIRQYQRLFH